MVHKEVVALFSGNMGGEKQPAWYQLLAHIDHSQKSLGICTFANCGFVGKINMHSSDNHIPVSLKDRKLVGSTSS